MNKRAWSSFLIMAVMAGSLPATENAWAISSGGASLSISAPSAILLDATTQKIIYAKSPHVRRPPASTTKVMTALVILNHLSLDTVVRIPNWVVTIEPSKAYLRPGERYRVRDLLHASLISSANDAAEVLGVYAAGSRVNFAKWMNDRARRMGCWDTHFGNASGLPPALQYSTVYDLALIMKEARRYPFIVDSLGRKFHTIKSLEGRRIHLRNHNKLLWRSPRTVIGKTGYTRKGRHCFVGRIQMGGREVFVSLLGSHRLWNDLKILLDYQFGVALYKIHINQRRYTPSETAAIQTALGRAGVPAGSRDGKFGPRTVRAVELFQKHAGLRSDGILGPLTCKRLTRYGLPSATCR